MTEVQRVVGMTFEETVMHRKHEGGAVVMLHIPRCGLCEAFFPSFRALAKSFARNPRTATVGFLEMDVSANDVPLPELFPVQKFPSLFAFPPHEEAPLRFSGVQWEEQELSQWLMEVFGFGDSGLE
eukprot:RCo011100